MVTLFCFCILFLIALFFGIHTMLMKKSILFLILTLISVKLWAQQDYLNNQTIIFNETISHVTTHFPDSLKQRSYSLRFNDATEQSLGQLRAMLFSNGISLSTNYSDSPSLQFTISTDNSLIRRSKSEWNRQISAIIAIQAIDTNGIILWVDQFNLQYSDTIQSRNVPDLVTDWSPTRFRTEQTRRPAFSALRFIEPVLISTAVATTIYLLYNVRSQ